MSLIPSNDRRYLDDRGYTYCEVVDGGNRGLVLNDFSLPECKFQVCAANVLILLPPGYPDSSPDMFYVLPWLTLASSGTYPRQADQPLVFNSDKWQRWSRHSSEWRPGVDGIGTMIRRVNRALQEAA